MVVVEPAQGQQPLRWGLASADMTTGEVQMMQREESSTLHQQLTKQEASELLWHFLGVDLGRGLRLE